MKNKHLLLLAIVSPMIWLQACSSSADSQKEALQRQVDSLKQQLAQAYRPGLGEFMMGIQVHHAKIWFAGKNQNWDLANFEVGEIKETLEDVKQYCADRTEVKSLPIIYPALDSISNAIKAKSLKRFETNFVFLTNSCNSCHQSTHHQFNIIKTPDVPPATNQVYGIEH